MTHEEAEFRRYLLGELAGEERDALERRLMTSDDAFRELLAAEDDLVDAYCAGELNENEKQLFLSHFLVTGERRHQVRFAAALRDYVSAIHGETTPVLKGLVKRFWRRLLAPELSVWKLSTAAALLALAVGGVWMIVSLSTDGPGELAGGSSVASLFLTREQFRAFGEVTELDLPPSAEVLELQLDLRSDRHGSYGVVLERADGTEVFTQQELKPRTIEGYQVVVAAVPVSLLTPGDYRVLLRGTTRPQPPEIVGRYDFRILSP